MSDQGNNGATGQVAGAGLPALPAPTRQFSLAAFDAFLANVAILNAEGEILEVNRAWREFAASNGGGDNVGDNYLAICQAAEGDDRADGLAIANGIQAVLSGKQQVFELEYPCHSPNEKRYFVARVSSFKHEDVQLVMVAHENITRRKLAELQVVALNQTLEARVQERTRALELSRAALAELTVRLEESNRDLAEFAFIASHDLQEPLRTIGVYADVLRRRYEGTLDARADGYLGHIGEQVIRARHLVRDVLALAKVSVTPELSNLNLRDVWQNLTPSLPWPEGARYSCQDLPLVQANAGQLHQLLSNLLSNAIKFRSATPLEVTLSAEREGEYVRFCLQDNGIGIAPEYAEQVFGMFQRLHTRSTVGGNGIGLAICRKIIERHGGSIWLEPGQGGGTSVMFTLRAAHSVTASELPQRAAGVTGR